MDKTKTNSMRFTKEQMDKKYPDWSTWDAKSFSNKHFHWVENGTCKICKIYIKEIEFSKSEEIVKDRSCRKCNKRLSPSRYLHCEACIPELDGDDGDLVYHQLNGREEDDIIEEI